MKLSIAKSVGKKIILIVVCAVLLLIFMSSSYGGIDPRYAQVQEHPNQEDLCPKHRDVIDIFLLAIPLGNNISIAYVRIDSKDLVPKNLEQRSNPKAIVIGEEK